MRFFFIGRNPAEEIKKESEANTKHFWGSTAPFTCFFFVADTTGTGRVTKEGGQQVRTIWID